MNQTMIMKAAISGLVWGLTYLYIRRYFNPETREKYMKYGADAFYGAIAAAIAFVVKALVNDYLNL